MSPAGSEIKQNNGAGSDTVQVFCSLGASC